MNARRGTSRTLRVVTGALVALFLPSACTSILGVTDIKGTDAGADATTGTTTTTATSTATTTATTTASTTATATTTATTTGTTSGTTSGTTTGVDAGAFVCPATQPTNGASCSLGARPFAGCTYGTEKCVCFETQGDAAEDVWECSK